MSGSFFDSNILVYLFDDVDHDKRLRAGQMVEEALVAGGGVISHQVVQETLNVILRKLATPATVPDGQHFLETVLLPLWQIMPNVNLYRRGMDIQGRYQYSFYDSLIIAAALEAGCTRLLTEDLQHGQRIERLTIENPFIDV